MDGSRRAAASGGGGHADCPGVRQDDAEVGPFPFFYWYQLAWIPLVAVLSTIAYLLVRRSR
jgi:hypothetical protein